MQYTLCLTFLFISLLTITNSHGAKESTSPTCKEQVIPITIKSDGSTWITMQGMVILKPQKLRKKSLQLPPGRYRIVGRKYGYQTVTFMLIIKEGYIYEPITVICKKRLKEKISKNKIRVIEGKKPKIHAD